MGDSVVSLAVGAGAHERVLVLRAVGGGGQRVPGQGGHRGAPPIGERGRGGGRRDGALVVSLLLQEFLLRRPGGRELKQAGGLQDWDATLPPAGVLAEGHGGGGGGDRPFCLIWDVVFFSSNLAP